MENLTKCYCGHTTTCDCGPEETEQETLEEATNNYVNYCAANISENEDLADADKRGFIYGAKWQQERSYSEEEVLNIIQLFNDDFNMIQDTIPKWFEQFKKI